MIAVLFDLEGTLVDCFAHYRDFISSSKKKLVELGLPAATLGDQKKSALMINNAFDYIEQNLNINEVKDFKFKLDQFLKGYELPWAEQSKKFPDTISTLSKLKKMNYPLGLVTNTSRLAMDKMIEKNQLRDFFDVFVSRSDVSRLKPDPEGVKLALDKLNTDDFFFIGDLIYDFEATVKLGGVSIIVNRKKSQLLVDPKYEINTLSEIPAILEKHLNSI